MSDIRNYLNLIERAAIEAPHEVHQDGAPEIGVKFEYQGGSYAAVGWMTELRVPGQFGKRGGKLVACRRDQATWVIGVGGKHTSGTVAPVKQVGIRGRMPWNEAQHKRAVDHAMELISKRFTITKPGNPS
jgi:hypothetical protein